VPPELQRQKRLGDYQVQSLKRQVHNLKARGGRAGPMWHSRIGKNMVSSTFRWHRPVPPHYPALSLHPYLKSSSHKAETSLREQVWGHLAKLRLLRLLCASCP
jgi:hypothetical protein